MFDIGQMTKAKHDIYEEANDCHPAFVLASKGERLQIVAKRERLFDFVVCKEDRPSCEFSVKVEELEEI